MADPISRSSSSQSSHASLSGEADYVANILGHAARLARLDPASFPTVYNTSAATFPDSQLAMTPLLAQLIAMGNDLGASVTFVTSQVESLTSAQAERSATPSPPATSNLEASLKDLSSRVAALWSHRATQVAPPPAPAVQAKPAPQKRKLATRLTSRTIAAPDFPFLIEGKWYGNPDTYANRHPDSPQAGILFTSRHVTGAPYRVVNSKVATAPKLNVEDKDRVNNSRRIKTVKLNIVKLKASLNKFSRGKLVIEVECQTLKLK